MSGPARRAFRRVGLCGLAAALLALGGSAPSEDSAGYIHGTLVNAASGDPVAGVRGSVEGLPNAVISNRDGEFYLPDLPNGEQDIHFRHPCYLTVTVRVTVMEGEGRAVPLGLPPVGEAEGEGCAGG